MAGLQGETSQSVRNDFWLLQHAERSANPLVLTATQLWGANQPELPQDEGDFWQRLINFAAGFAEVVTGGLSGWAIRQMGLQDYVNTRSAYYRAGGYVGQVANIALSLIPGGGLALTALRGAVYGTQLLGGVATGIEAGLQGNYFGAFMAAAGVGMTIFRAVGPCVAGTALGQAGESVVRGLGLVGMGAAAYHAVTQIAAGDYLGAALSVAQIGADAFRASQSCFTAETELLTKEGYKRIDQFRPGDRLLSRSEFDPEGPLEEKEVEAVFSRYAKIWHLHVQGRVIRTTGEHPFWVVNKWRWVEAELLEPGDVFVSHDGQCVTMEEVYDTGVWEPVYNVCVADHHTYFVGGDGWGWNVWAHNAKPCTGTTKNAKAKPASDEVLVRGPNPNKLVGRRVKKPTDGEGGVYQGPKGGKTKTGSTDDFGQRYKKFPENGFKIKIEYKQTVTKKPAGVDDSKYKWTPRRQRRFDEEYIDRSLPAAQRYRAPGKPTSPVKPDKWRQFRGIFGYGGVDVDYGR